MLLYNSLLRISVAFVFLIGSAFSIDAMISDETSKVNLNGVSGIVAAYGDFNGDRYTDIFVVAEDWTVVNVYLWDVQNQNFDKSAVNVRADNIVGISPSDFNNDGSMDALISTKENDLVQAQVYLGDKKTLKKDSDLKVSLKDQPSIVEANGDYFPDLFGTDLNGNRTYWILVPGADGQRAHFTQKFQNDIITEIVVPNSNGFVDATGDNHPSLVVKSKGGPDKKFLFEVWQQRGVDMELLSTFIFDVAAELVGQSSFVDIDSDGNMDLIVPVCVKNDCVESKIYYKQLTKDTIKHSRWNLLASNENENWQFNTTMFTSKKLPTTLIWGDFILDGHFDAVCVLQKKDESRQLFAARLRNVKCGDVRKCNGTRSLQVYELHSSIKKPLSVSMMDVHENGNLDFIISYENQGKLSIMVLKNNMNNDFAFLKVAVLTGGKVVPKFTSNLVGAIAKVETSNTDGVKLTQKACQWTQTAYFALQRPYVIIGLGASPNFVEKLTIGVSNSENTEVNRVRTWTAIIPNAQVIVLPVPKDEPNEWETKLLVTPSKLLLQIGGVLIGTCLLIAGIILILHIKEKKEDDKEKRQESHKFHFDAL